MSAASCFEPAKGDVIFIYKSGMEPKASAFIQRMIDPAANAADLMFDHVAIAITDLLALEAVPAPRDDGDERDQNDRLPHTVEIAPWSGVELRGGVRLIPIPDLVIPARDGGGRLHVLRHPDMDPKALERLKVVDPDIARIIGSAYSVDGLQQAAKERFGRLVTDRVALKLALSSMPIDVATKLGMTRELRSEIEAALPEFVVPEVARSFFCSQLVAACLDLVGVLPESLDESITTPTGLYKLLADEGWTDVSNNDYARSDDPVRPKYLYEMAYYTTLMHAVFASRQEVLKALSDLHGAMAARDMKYLGTLNERIQRLGRLPEGQRETPGSLQSKLRH